MALRRLTPTTFKAHGLSDSLDGTNAFPGAMLSLQNLAPAPGTEGAFVPRAAAESQTTFGGFTSPGQISAMRVVGTRVYGMIASARFAGKDEPFIYDVVLGSFVAISGLTSALLPTTQATTGDWQPPKVEAVTNSRILVTHPGFAGGAGPFFGWFDISSFSTTALKGNLTSGSPIITSINDGSTSAPIIDGVQPGQTITGTGIPAGTYVVSCTNGAFTLATAGNTTSGSTAIASVHSVVGVLAGMSVTGPDIAAGTTVVSVVGSTVNISVAALATTSNSVLAFAGGGTITMSANASASNNNVTLTIAGGTSAAPLWGAGNTNTNPLAAVPNTVGSFSGRAWFGVANAAVFSDPLNPTQVSLAAQALICGDNQDITALVGLPLTSQLTGGTVQSLIAFKGAQAFYQITGDAAANDLALSLVNGSVGTLAPNTIVATPLGLAFISPGGLRILGETGLVTDPVGAFGKGVSVPFINALTPSRMSAAFGQNTMRISVQNGGAAGQPTQEYWLQFEQKTWTGPHTFPSALIQPYVSSTKVGFICAPTGITASLWFHTVIPTLASIYIENGANLAWMWVTSLLPDNGSLAANNLVEGTLAMSLAPGSTVSIVVQDETGATLDTVTKTGAAVTAVTGFWGSGVWGAFNWGALSGYFKQYRLSWHVPIIVKQCYLSVAGSSAAGFAIGNMYLGFQILGYMLQGDEDPVIVVAPRVPLLDAFGNPLLDAYGNILYAAA